MPDYDSLLKRYEREKSARLKAESILAEKSRELYDRSEELRKLTVNLEEKVVERTTELSIARDEALRAARAKADFLAHMSHEIRTPLNGVLGMLTMLSETRLDNQQQQLLMTASQSGEHLLGIINDILDFSKIEAGMMTLEHAAVPLRGMLEDIVSSMKGMADQKQLALTLDIDTDLPTALMLDALRVRQVLLNLISNAIKFTQRGSIRLNASRRKQWLDIEVTDTGMGIPDAVKDSIFDAFNQADSTISRRFGGTGLGLSITHKLVRMMGGTVSVRSEMGSGSTFTVSLPIEEAIARQSSKGSPHSNASLKGFRVMLVEDNEVNQVIARHMLEKLGVKTFVCSGGQQAITALINDGVSVDLILMDLQMPGMNGYETTHRIRQISPEFEDLPIIAMTAHATDEHRQESMEQGMDEHISKPIKLDRLGSILRDFLITDPAAPTPPQDSTDTMTSAQINQQLTAMLQWLGKDLLRVEDIARQLQQAKVPESERKDVATICELALDFDLDGLELELTRKLQTGRTHD